ncbi:DUF2127 domain-containing protein [Patescibacteria group bacterium]|nr:DUF2127 domain-containing protein [Patescibacteria group bacterium]
MFHLKEKNIYRIFEISVLLKALDGVLELIGGLAFVFYGTTNHLILILTQHELLEDPQDLVANFARHLLPTLSSSTRLFAALYLLSHGIIKVLIVAGLLTKRLWSYPLSIGVLALFIVYQLYQYTFTHLWGLLALSAFDAFIIVLVWHEYRYLSRQKA